MMRRPSLRSLLSADRPLILPSAHDALSARLIEAHGFEALAISGSAMLAARYALPDLGLAGLGEMLDGTRDIMAAVDIACLVDGDDGYGDVKAVARTVRAYERLGAGAIVIEDQARTAKQPGQAKARAVVDDAEIAAKLKVALQTREDPDFYVIGRTDAYGAAGLDAALRRIDMYAGLGVDGLFVAGLQRPEEFERVGRAFGGHLLLAVLYDGGSGVWQQPADLHEMGFRMVGFPASLIVRIVDVMNRTLAELRGLADGKGSSAPYERQGQGFAAFQDAVRLPDWLALEGG